MFYIGMMTDKKRKNDKGYKYISKGFKIYEECENCLKELKKENLAKGIKGIPYFISDGKI